MIKLIGIAVVAAGFALRLNPLLVVVATATFFIWRQKSKR